MSRITSSVMACLLAVLSLVGCAGEPPQNLLIVSLDTTRRDHVSAYGYGRDTTPRIDALAATGAVFENAFAVASATNPTHATMFTGLYPLAHGVGANTRKITSAHSTLAEMLSAKGFRTGGFVSGFPLRKMSTGIPRGFEVWDAKFQHTRRDGRETTDRALGWLGSIPTEQPYLLFVHFYDAHGPYAPNQEYLGTFRSEDPGPALRYVPKYQQTRGEDGTRGTHLNHFVDRYDTQVRYTDDLVAELLAAVDLEKTVVAILADHGETFVGRGSINNLSHGGSVVDEQIRIPYILYSPDIEPGRFHELVDQTDLAPTLLDLLGVEPPEGALFQGASLGPLLRGERQQEPDGLVFATSPCWPKRYRGRRYHLDDKRHIHTARSRRWKLVVFPGIENDYYELYNVEHDQLEHNNVADEFPRVVARLSGALGAWLANETAETEELELTPDEVEKMQALGYLGN